jgi:hypothetical protein
MICVQDHKTKSGDLSHISSIWLAEMATVCHFRQSDAWDLRLVSNLSFMILGPWQLTPYSLYIHSPEVLNGYKLHTFTINLIIIMELPNQNQKLLHKNLFCILSISSLLRFFNSQQSQDLKAKAVDQFKISSIWLVEIECSLQMEKSKARVFRLVSSLSSKILCPARL